MEYCIFIRPYHQWNGINRCPTHASCEASTWPVFALETQWIGHFQKGMTTATNAANIYLELMSISRYWSTPLTYINCFIPTTLQDKWKHTECKYPDKASPLLRGRTEIHIQGVWLQDLAFTKCHRNERADWTIGHKCLEKLSLLQSKCSFSSSLLQGYKFKVTIIELHVFGDNTTVVRTGVWCKEMVLFLVSDQEFPFTSKLLLRMWPLS